MKATSLKIKMLRNSPSLIFAELLLAHSFHRTMLAAMKLILMISMVVILGNAAAQERPCTNAESIEAESSAARLMTWEDIYLSFKKFRHCDDGAIAEGYSDSVVRMLADRWNRLDTLIWLSSSDKDFRTFVLRHIDATADKSALERIMFNSRKHCSESASDMCSMIEKTAKEVLREIK